MFIYTIGVFIILMFFSIMFIKLFGNDGAMFPFPLDIGAVWLQHQFTLHDRRDVVSDILIKQLDVSFQLLFEICTSCVQVRHFGRILWFCQGLCCSRPTQPRSSMLHRRLPLLPSAPSFRPTRDDPTCIQMGKLWQKKFDILKFGATSLCTYALSLPV